MPSGTAHVLASEAFPISVMGKTGTTNEFRDALFVGSTYGVDGVTVAVRIGFDDNRSLGKKETQDRPARPVPSFPAEMEHRTTQYLQRDPPVSIVDTPAESEGIGDAARPVATAFPVDTGL